MPIYSYKCSGCGSEEEIIHSSSDGKTRNCEKCGAALERQIAPIAVIFKGSGFHKNDYSHGSGGGASASSSPAPKKEEAAKETAAASAAETPKAEAPVSGKTSGSGDGGTKVA